MSSSLASALIAPEFDVQSVLPKLEIDVDLKPEISTPNNQDEDEEMEDLFGNDDDDNDGQERQADTDAPSPEPSETEQDKQRRRLEYEEEEAAPEMMVEVQEAEVAFPNLPVPKSSDGDNWVVRIPNFVKVDSKPFHPDTYVGPEHEDEELLQAESVREKSMTIKLKVENTLRWRWTKDQYGNDTRQSNSRIIRWSDGTLSLRLGKELFDINQSIDTSGGVPRQSFGGPPGSQLASQPTTASGKSQGLTYLVAQHKRSQVLQAEALITGYMTLRPTGMQSETHRMLVRAVGQKHNKIARLRMAPDPTTDPEREKLELMKQDARKSRKKPARAADGFGGRRTKKRPRKQMSQEWSDDEDEVFGAGTDDEDDLGRKRNRPDPDKRGGDYQEDGFVVDDESEEDGEGENEHRKRRRADDTMEDDPLDALDAKIEDSQRRRQKEAAANGEDVAAKGDEVNEMDVESEDDDEEFKVRRASRSKKRKAAYEDEEEE